MVGQGSIKKPLLRTKGGCHRNSIIITGYPSCGLFWLSSKWNLYSAATVQVSCSPMGRISRQGPTEARHTSWYPYHVHYITSIIANIIRNVCPLNDSEENSQRLTKVWGYARSGENFEKLWNLKSSTCETLVTSSICFETVKAISLAEHDINDVDCELKLDYKVWSEWVKIYEDKHFRCSFLPKGEGRALCSWHS